MNLPVAVKRALRGAGGGGKMGGGEQHTPVEAPDTLHSVAFARIIDLISEGECEGLVLNLQDVFLDETPVQNADLTFNFKNVHFEQRTGTQDQEPLPGFPDTESETAVGVAIETDTPYTHNFTNLALTGVRLRLAVAALMEVDEETGDTNGYIIEYAIDMAVDGGPFLQILQSAFNGKTTTPFERGHDIDLPPATTNWMIRVRRITPESDSQLVQDDMSIVSFTELVRANLRMSNSAVVGLIIDASQFRSIPTRAYRFRGRIIRVPSNYDPINRTYDGVWDGTFQLAWSNNPAWVWYDMATNFRYGLGRFITDADVDKWSLYAIAQYCDTLVDDGLGGSEPRFTCDIYLQKAADAYKVMQDLASVFRGICYWAAGQIVAVADSPQDPVYSYTNSSVIGGKFSYQSSSRQARHTVALVQWSDPQDFGRGKVQYVPYEEGIARYGIQKLDITAIGATSQGQAERCGRWALLTENYETNTVTFAVGLDGAIPQPGKIIRVQDTLRSAGSRRGGRIRSATSSVITPDAMPPSTIPGDSMTVVLPTGVTQTRTISAMGTDTITVSPAYDAAPIPHAAWIVESAELTSQLFKVLGVKEEDGIQFTIVATQHAPEKFDESDFGIVIQQPVVKNAPPKVIAPPATITVENTVVNDGPVERNKVVATWEPVAAAVSYEVSYKRGLGYWSPPMRVMTPRFEVENAPPGDYRFRVKALSSTGLASLERLSDTAPVAQIIPAEILISDSTGEVITSEDGSQILYSE